MNLFMKMFFFPEVIIELGIALSNGQAEMQYFKIE